MILVVKTKKSSEKPAMVKTKARTNLFISAALFMIASPRGVRRGLPGRLRITDQQHASYLRTSDHQQFARNVVGQLDWIKLQESCQLELGEG